MVALPLSQGIAAYPARCTAVGGRSGAWEKEVGVKGGTSAGPLWACTAAREPSLTSSACPTPALLAVSGLQVPDIAAQAPAHFLSDAASPLQKLLPSAVDASPNRSENADMSHQMLNSLFSNPFSLDGTKTIALLSLLCARNILSTCCINCLITLTTFQDRC